MQLRGERSQSHREWVKSPEEIVPLALFIATQPDQGPSGLAFRLMRGDM